MNATSVDIKTALGFEPVRLPAGSPPRLFVVVDTEEEFDWAAPFSRDNTSVSAMRHIGRLQDILSRYRIVPTYVVDFPVASQPQGFEPLKEFADSGRARIGAHLHPWVNPPFVEDVNGRNSFGCCLDDSLERRKIEVLKTQIGTSFGRFPTVYKAGRYGFGPSTASALEALDFAVDVSVNPQMNFESEGGPSFEAFDTTPFFFGGGRRLLEIPCSTDYVGVCGPLAPRVHRANARPAFERTRVLGVMSHLHVINKVMLSPEGATLAEMKALTRTLIRRGVRTFSLTLHSPSVEPGRTPYVRSAADLRQFLDCITAYCNFFVEDLGGVPSTPEDFLQSLDGRQTDRIAEGFFRQGHSA